MKVAASVAEVRRWRAAAAGDVGLVPTMGYLHAGHVSLVERARHENARVAASVFVNPTQFGPGEDLARYPRDLERDRRLLEDAGCDLLFAPAPEEMYPPAFASVVDPGPVAAPLEGERRPGHFRGVATVVLKLLGVFTPTRAYFGEKDAQQLAVIRRVVADLDLPVQVVGCPTVREPDGLAMSSRNSYLDAEHRRAAPVLYRALTAAREAVRAGERDAEALRAVMRGAIGGEPLARLDYAAVADPDTFRELDRIEGPALALLAVRVGPARLIDNLRLDG
ncbi:MAG TPA: pantoate--beta-alanine ligase [Vicinamibacteria bacterium]|nr:pantoate--beta-alanine ligase [Vicinamibacteria bacterium]